MRAARLKINSGSVYHYFKSGEGHQERRGRSFKIRRTVPRRVLSRQRLIRIPARKLPKFMLSPSVKFV